MAGQLPSAFWSGRTAYRYRHLERRDAPRDVAGRVRRPCSGPHEVLSARERRCNMTFLVGMGQKGGQRQ